MFITIAIFNLAVVGVLAAATTTGHIVLDDGFRILLWARRYTMLNRIPQEILACRVCIPGNNFLRSQGDSIF